MFGPYNLIQFGEEEKIILKIREMCKFRPKGVTLPESYKARLAGNQKKDSNERLLMSLVARGIMETHEVDGTVYFKMATK